MSVQHDDYRMYMYATVMPLYLFVKMYICVYMFNTTKIQNKKKIKEKLINQKKTTTTKN